MHRRDFKTMSFKIDIRGEARLKGMEEFSLQKPSARNYTTELFASKVMNNYQIMSPRHHYTRLYINGEHIGIRHIEEGFGRELVEHNKRRYGPIYFSDGHIGKVLDNKGAKYFGFDAYNKKYWKENNDNLLRQGFYVIDGLNNNEYDFINKYFDLDLWAKFFAISDSLNLFHGTGVVAVRFYLNPVSGLIEPIFYNGHFESGKWDNWDNYKFNFSDLINYENNNCGWICANKTSKTFYHKFFGYPNTPNISFYKKYINELKEITSIEASNDYLKPIWDSLKIYRGHLYKDGWRINRWHGQGLLPHIGKWGSFNKRILNIRERIRQSNQFIPKFEVDTNKKIIKALNVQSEFPQIISYKCNRNKLQENILLLNKPKILNYSNIKDCFYEDIQFSLNEENKYVFVKDVIVKNTDLFSRINDQKKNLISVSSDYPDLLNNEIKENKKSQLIMEDGYFECIKKDSILHIKNKNLIIKGTKNNPVRISSCPGSENIGGGIIIENSDVSISYLQIENQKVPLSPLRTLYGGINFINSDIFIDQLEVKNSNSEDAINFINSKINGNNLKIKSSISDAIDLDNSNINFKSIECLDIGNDCLDLSFSTGKIRSISAQNINDKGVSLGERSLLELDSFNIINAEIGAVSKDSSVFNLNKMRYENVKLPFAAYIKKPEFGSPKLFIRDITPSLAGNYLVGNDVEVMIGDKKIISSLSSSKIEEMLYGNLYGVKTKR